MLPFLHVWQADLAANELPWPAVLSLAEQQRQARLRTPLLSHAYGRAHVFLRAVLSQYTGQAAAALQLQPDANGKPALSDFALQFNLSYRPGRALLAVSNAYAVGVDVEPLQPLTDTEALVQQLFSASEQAAWQAAEPVERLPLFYTIWTRKEAYAKVLGMGIEMSFAAFSVLEFSKGNPFRLTSPMGSSLSSFAVGTGYIGAIAALTTKPLPTIQHFNYAK